MCSQTVAGSAQTEPETSVGRSVEHGEAEENVQSVGGEKKRRRCSPKTKIDLVACVQKEERSYAKSWVKYIHGNVVSQTSQRFMTNLLSATAARVVEEPGERSILSLGVV